MTGLLRIKSNGWVNEFKYHFCIIDDSVICYKSILKGRLIIEGYYKNDWNSENHIIK